MIACCILNLKEIVSGLGSVLCVFSALCITVVIQFIIGFDFLFVIFKSHFGVVLNFSV